MQKIWCKRKCTLLADATSLIIQHRMSTVKKAYIKGPMESETLGLHVCENIILPIISTYDLFYIKGHRVMLKSDDPTYQCDYDRQKGCVHITIMFMLKVLCMLGSLACSLFCSETVKLLQLYNIYVNHPSILCVVILVFYDKLSLLVLPPSK